MAASATVVDPHAERFARNLINELAQRIGALEGTLAACAGCFDEGLPASVVGSMGIKAEELRQQLPALREAAREVGRV